MTDYDTPEFPDFSVCEDEAPATLREELLLIIEKAEGTDLAALIPQAQALLSLPDESIAALVEVAQNSVEAVKAAQRDFYNS